MVVISHGSGGSLLGHRDTAQFLAEHGYIVAALLHSRNNFADNAHAGTTQKWADRPQHVSFALDTILQHTKFAKHSNQNKIAIIGHSAGGYTALVLLGGVPDTKYSRLHCQNNYQQDAGYCDVGKIEEHRDMKIEGLLDKRFRAGVLLAPIGILFADKKSLAAVDAPILLYRAEDDAQLHFPFHAERIAKNLPKPDSLTYMNLKNANHFAFIAPFPKSIAQQVGLPAKDNPGFNHKEAHQTINATILDKTL